MAFKTRYMFLPLSLCIAFVSPTHAAHVAGKSADLTITGTIKPGSCTPTFAGSNTVNFATIQEGALEKNLDLPNTNLAIQISCTSPLKIALTLFDLQPPFNKPLPSEHRLNLVTSNQQKNSVGNYWFTDFAAKADNKDVTVLQSSDRESWTPAVNSFPLFPKSSVAFSTSGNSPESFKEYTVRFVLKAQIDQRKGGLTEELKYEGKSTFQITYI